MFRKTTTLLVSALALLASSLAMAEGLLVNVKSEVVRYDDIRLSSKVGVAVLYGRLRQAAERACAPLYGVDLPAKNRYRKCFDEALGKAVATVAHSGLTEYYEQRRGVTAPNEPVQSVTVVASGD
ncbi:MAG TPA: UrcA family protein [Steroidobacteraceae bacterium]